jgi:probable HAF family extracellular repeat protein
MKILNVRNLTAAVVLLAAVAYGNDLQALQETQRTRYHVTNLSSLGGTSSAGNSINNRNWVAGFSNFPGDDSTHAVLWSPFAAKLDLGTLGGPNSNVAWPVKNTNGVITGIAETAMLDSLGEAWSCSAFFPSSTGHTCLGFVWEGGVMAPLPTLGGTNGFATGSNNRGQVVGWAENTVHDPACNPPQVLQFRAVVWEPKRGRVRALPPFPGDKVGAATAVNDSGQVVGISGICDNAVGRFSAIHAVLWENGTVKYLGSLGGVAWNTPMAINERGDVVGFANVPGGSTPGSFNAHAFLWTASRGMRDLGTLRGDVLSQALGINERRQVVGLSCTAGFASCRAFLWQDGIMIDLNRLVAAGYRDHLFFANDINDRGRITGQAVASDASESLAFVAIPITRQSSDSGVGSSMAEAGAYPTPQVILPENVRHLLLQRLGLRGAELSSGGERSR